MELFTEENRAEFSLDKEFLIKTVGVWKVTMNEAITLLQPILDGDLIRDIGTTVTPLMSQVADFLKLDLPAVNYRNPGWLFRKLSEVTSSFLETVTRVHSEHQKCKKQSDKDEKAYEVLKETFVWVSSTLPSAGL